jgi:hypothetical protein
MNILAQKMGAPQMGLIKQNLISVKTDFNTLDYISVIHGEHIPK